MPFSIASETMENEGFKSKSDMPLINGESLEIAHIFTSYEKIL